MCLHDAVFLKVAKNLYKMESFYVESLNLNRNPDPYQVNLIHINNNFNM